MIAALLILAALGPEGPDPGGRRLELPGGATLILPGDPPEAGPIDLVVHLHGAVPAVERALDESGWDAAAVVVNRPGLSSAYSRPFSDPSLFPTLLDQARSALADALPEVDPDAGRLIASAFSAGFGGIREILKQRDMCDRIDALVLADSLYCGYDGDPAGRRLDPDLMLGFRRFAAEAASGRKAMLVSHCALVPDGYGSTAETADDLVRHVGGAFRAVEQDRGDGWLQSREFRRGGLLVIGFEGEAGEDHLRHLRGLGTLWRMLPAVAGDEWAEADPDPSGFVRVVWSPDRRVRVNAPETADGPYKDRPEASAAGRLTIPVDLDPAELPGASLYLELWGGHPGTASKAVTVNGKATYPIPEVGTAAGHCTYHYPSIPLDPEHLVRGENVFQFSCREGSGFWGHFIVDNAALHLHLPPDHPEVRNAGLSGFEANVAARPVEGEERILLAPDAPPGSLERIASVDFLGRYFGYDEDGDALRLDWHGFTKGREPMGHLGTADTPPFRVDWDTTMVPDQRDMAARAVVRFKDLPGLVYRTPETEGLATPDRGDVTVRLIEAEGQPVPFWSRADRERACTLPIGVDPAAIDRAVLRITIWDGGKGEVEDPVTLNGHPLPVAGAGRHDLLDRAVEVDPETLARGPNRLRVRSDTEHHGIEVLHPGPALIVRARR